MQFFLKATIAVSPNRETPWEQCALFATVAEID
jgi:hypothetical protein